MTNQSVGSATPARLMTAVQTANYLGYKSPSVLGQFPVRPILVGKGRRWDRTAIDRHLDLRSGLINQRSESSNSEVIDEIDRHFR